MKEQRKYDMGSLTIFISRLIDIMSKNGEDSNSMDVCIDIRKEIDLWIKANDLHPEDVQHFKTREDLIKYLNRRM